MRMETRDGFYKINNNDIFNYNIIYILSYSEKNKH